MVRVLLVDDHEVVRAGLKALLEASGQVQIVGQASSGDEAVDKAQTLEPDIVIMDLAMPGTDGVEATRRITELDTEAKILVLTIHDEDEFLVPAMEAGAAGFLNKSVADTDLLGAVEALVHGHSYLPSRAAALLARREGRAAAGRGPGLQALSARERTAIELYARGFSATEAGREMSVSPKTVEGYIARAKAKLGVKSRRDIVGFALETGILRPKGKQ